MALEGCEVGHKILIQHDQGVKTGGINPRVMAILLIGKMM